MAYKIVFSGQVKIDIQESRKWYDKKQKGLGKKFYTDVKKGLESIA